MYTTSVYTLLWLQYKHIAMMKFERGVLNFELGTDVWPEVSTTTL